MIIRGLICHFSPELRTPPGAGMIKDAKARGIAPLRAGYGAGPLRITDMDSMPGLVIAGEIDEDTYPVLVARLNDLAAGAPEFHFDLAGVEYCDLAGLRPSSS